MRKEKVYKTKKCNTCFKEFLPSSRHKDCPSCRKIKSKISCLNCEKLIRREHKYCVKCSNRLFPRGKTKKDFYYYTKKALDRSLIKDRETDLDEEFLKELWESQKGLCAITKVPIELSVYEWKLGKNKVKPNSASLDRIDSSIGYIKGNVQFISFSMNLAKWAFDEKVFIQHLNDIVKSMSKNECKSEL